MANPVLLIWCSTFYCIHCFYCLHSFHIVTTSENNVYLNTGNKFFDRLTTEHTVQLFHPYEVERQLNSTVDVDRWIMHLKSYVVAANTTLISDKKLVFVIEMQTFRTKTTPQRQLSVMVSDLLQSYSIDSVYKYNSVQRDIKLQFHLQTRRPFQYSCRAGDLQLWWTCSPMDNCHWWNCINRRFCPGCFCSSNVPEKSWWLCL